MGGIIQGGDPRELSKLAGGKWGHHNWPLPARDPAHPRPTPYSPAHCADQHKTNERERTRTMDERSIALAFERCNPTFVARMGIGDRLSCLGRTRACTPAFGARTERHVQRSHTLETRMSESTN